MRAVNDARASLAVTEEIAAVVREAGEAQVEYVLERSGRTATIDFRIPPAVLEVPDDARRLTIVEHGEESVPGSRGYLEVSIGTIGGYRALMTLKGADGKPYIRQTSVTPGNTRVFTYCGKEYQLTVAGVSQSVFGDDYIILDFGPHVPAPASQPSE